MMRPFRRFPSILAVLLIPLLPAVWVGCSPRKLMVRQFVQMVETGLPAVEQEDDLQLLAQSLPAHIKLLETLLVNDPNNADLLLLLARLHGGYAFAVLETEHEARRCGVPPVVATGIPAGRLDSAVAGTYRKGAGYALQALEVRHPKAGHRLSRLKTSDAFIDGLRRSDVPALFWYGFNLAGYIQHRLDRVEVMAKAHLVEKTMRRVAALDASYYHGGAHLVLMTYYASRSASMGGNPELARVHMEKHLLVDPDSMMIRSLLWSRYALVQQQNRNEFIRLLSQVGGEAQKERNPDLLNRVAAVRAEIYLQAVDLFFEK